MKYSNSSLSILEDDWRIICMICASGDVTQTSLNAFRTIIQCNGAFATPLNSLPPSHLLSLLRDSQLRNDLLATPYCIQFNFVNDIQCNNQLQK